METKLKKLFEYQKFENNGRLAKLIAETEDRQSAELSDEDLSLVAAAGDLSARIVKETLQGNTEAEKEKFRS